MLNRVENTDRGTTFGFTPGGGGKVQLFLYTYFSVTATVIGGIGNPIFCHNATYVSGDRFVALPASNVCDATVFVRKANNPLTVASSTVKDQGPWFPHSTSTSGNPCVGPDDPYWNTGGVPRAATDPCSTNQAGIDLSNGTGPDVGITSSGQVYWRFN